MHRLIAASLLWAGAVSAAEVPCDNAIVTAEAESPELATRICAASDAALAHFASCALPEPKPVRILALNAFERECVGLFHCGEGLIEVLAPDAMEARRNLFGIFQHVPMERFFESVVLHEMSHAVFDGTPCAFAHCVASTEFFAYTQQIAALSDEDRAPIEALAQDMPARKDVLNVFVLYMAPDKFALEAWTYLNAEPDRCTFWQEMLTGEVHFDRALPR
ncbi:MAG: hypothetical protein KDK26_17675 [Roseivivax sp.]|nr:hypothetical protein [Roseivivax sp.]